MSSPLSISNQVRFSRFLATGMRVTSPFTHSISSVSSPEAKESRFIIRTLDETDIVYDSQLTENLQDGEEDDDIDNEYPDKRSQYGSMVSVYTTQDQSKRNFLSWASDPGK